MQFKSTHILLLSTFVWRFLCTSTCTYKTTGKFMFHINANVCGLSFVPPILYIVVSINNNVFIFIFKMLLLFFCPNQNQVLLIIAKILCVIYIFCYDESGLKVAMSRSVLYVPTTLYYCFCSGTKCLLISYGVECGAD